MLAACAASNDSTQQKGGKLSDVFATPDWNKFTSSKPTILQRAVTPNDLISADGRCVGTSEVVTAQVSTDGTAPETTSDALEGQGALPAMQGGIGLAMTECQVAQRTGAPDRVDIGAEATERVTTMTVLRGSWPGLYRFRSGRLVSIERVDVPAPAKPVRAAKPAKPSKTSQMRGAQR